ncbi:DNA-binding protein [Ideonella sp.]|uniref:DNA-binding protein n=1 Tax=Ideonella sp. TaxID=1929293 RepID=UPI003BB5BA04
MQPDRNAIETVRRRFYESGTTVTDWARERGFDRSLVYSVLNGRCLARRGASHRIAVALGLKPGADGAEAGEATMKT